MTKLREKENIQMFREFRDREFREKHTQLQKGKSQRTIIHLYPTANVTTIN